MDPLSPGPNREEKNMTANPIMTRNCLSPTVGR